MEFTITSSQILAVCALITALWGVWKIIKEVNKPNNDLKKQVQTNSQLLDNDNKRLKEMEESNKMILQCLLALINHDITGNCVDRLKDMRDELQEYLIKK